MVEKYLRLLSNTYRNSAETSAEIINLKAALHMPKGTEHFVSDIHGEYDSFNHVLKNASGVIKNYIHELFGTALLESDKRNLATLVYYPEEKIELVREKLRGEEIGNWYRVNLFRMMQICKRVSSKYTRASVRKALPMRYLYILEELIHEDADKLHKNAYYNEIIDTIIDLGAADDFIIAISRVIQRLAIDSLHVIGDIYDRGGGAERIMDILEEYHSVDVQWGNHDIAWMGAASGSIACICNVIRVSAKHNNLHTIEEGYGINLLPLATFAMENYGKPNMTDRFKPDNYRYLKKNKKEIDLIAKMNKAITVLQFKVEAEIINRHPEFEMQDRLLLNKIDFDAKSVIIDGKPYALADTDLPTVNPDAPFELTAGERDLVDKLVHSFQNSPKLRRHVRFLFNKGGMYKITNGNVLFHGCVPLNEDGTMKAVRLGVGGGEYKGKELLDNIDESARKGFFMPDGSPEKQYGLDLMWYLWCGADSPLYGKDKMATFERYFLNESKLHEESKDFYYSLREDESVCRAVLKDFGLEGEGARIINGHVPVMVRNGENPIKANGRLIVIDGGFTKAYQSVTGIAGYTLISNSQGVLLASHEPFVSSKEAVETEADIVSNTNYIERFTTRKKVGDTDAGMLIKETIKDMEQLLEAYRSGLIKERE